MLESDLATAIGIPRSQLREMRKKRPDYFFKDGRSIHLTSQGVDWVREEWGIEESEEIISSKFPATVFRSVFPNSKLIQVQAKPRGTDELLVVRVRDSQMYVPRMAVEIKRDGNGWTVTRHPRQRGKF
jgi:hypothetical protein